MTVLGNGNVGIGTTSPGARLDVEGGDIIDVDKISVNTIDPIFKIDGEKYVTYVPDVIGQKVIVAGQGKLENGKFEIDLKKQKKGSDLWLFYNIVKPDSIIPFVSPQDESLLYAFIKDSLFIVKLNQGNANSKFSYQLIGERIDGGESNLLPKEDKSSIYIDVEKYR